MKSKERLLSNGFLEEWVKTKVVETGNVAKAILKEAKQGRLAVVARERTGIRKGLLMDLPASGFQTITSEGLTSNIQV